MPTMQAAISMTCPDACSFSAALWSTDKFTGKERDSESGLDYFGARYYASSMGRWMSPDWADKPEAVPYSDLANPQSLNLYGYVNNNPLSKADADGHWPDWPSVGQFVAGAINAWGSDNLVGAGRVDQTTSAGAAGARLGDAVAAVQGVGGLAHLCTATIEAAPPFVMFERWVPRTIVSGGLAHP